MATVTEINEMKRKRMTLVNEARALNDKVVKEGRAYTAEEDATYKRVMAEVDTMRVAIAREEQLTALESESRAIPQQPGAGKPDIDAGLDGGQQRAAGDGAGTGAGGTGGQQQRAGLQGDAEVRLYGGRVVKQSVIDAQTRAFRTFLRGGYGAMSAEEYRVLQADIDTTGGYLVAPMQFVSELLKGLDNAVFIRPLARKFPLITAASMGATTLTSDIDDAEWTSEVATGSETTPAFGRRELHPHPLAKLVKATNKLLRMTPDAETLIRERLIYKHGVAEENAFLNGHGVNQPLGIFVASADGINTDRDVYTGHVTQVLADCLRSMKYKIKPQYWPRCQWVMHVDCVERISKLKDGNGQYYWRPGITEADPDRIQTFPLNISAYAPNTFTANLYVAVLGDFSNYWIADALDMQVQRLVELYAESNEVGFIGRKETDGAPVLSEAFARLQMHA